jgi:hypothetical protein
MSPITEGDDDEVEIVDVLVDDLRCFVERVYDMISLAQGVEEWRSLVKWEGAETAFSMPKSATELAVILPLQFPSTHRMLEVMFILPVCAECRSHFFCVLSDVNLRPGS